MSDRRLKEIRSAIADYEFMADMYRMMGKYMDAAECRAKAKRLKVHLALAD